MATKPEKDIDELPFGVAPQLPEGQFSMAPSSLLQGLADLIIPSAQASVTDEQLANKDAMQKMAEIPQSSPVPIHTGDETTLPIDISKAPQMEAAPVPTPAPVSPVQQLLQSTQPVSQKDYIGGLMRKIYPSSMGDEAIQAAQKQASDQAFLGRMTMAGQQIGSGLAKAPETDFSVAKDIIAKSQQPVEDILTRQAARSKQLATAIQAQDLNDRAQIQDPNSSVSQAARNMLSMYKPDMAQMPGFNGLNANAIFKLEPMIDTALKMEVMRGEKGRQVEEKDTKRLDAMNKLISGEMQRKNTALGSAANVYQAAERLEALRNQYKDAGQFNTSQLGEFATQLDTMLSGGTGAVARMKELLPRGVAADANKLLAYFTSQNRGAKMGSFIEQMMDTVHREKEVSAKQIQRAQQKLIASYTDLKHKSPEIREKWNNIMKLNGLPTEDEMQSVSKKDPKIEQYAKDHFNGDYDKAKKLLESRGYVSGQ